MAINTAPRFPIKPHLPAVTVSASTSNNYDGTHASVAVVALAVKMERIDVVRFHSLGTNAACVARIWINNGASAGTATNNGLVGEVALPATSASPTEQLASAEWWPSALVLPEGYRLLVGLSSAAAAGWSVVTSAGLYEE